jgi:hypothetical protein
MPQFLLHAPQRGWKLLLTTVALPALFLLATFLATPAQAATITIGYSDLALGGGINVLGSTASDNISIFNASFGLWGSGDIVALNSSGFYEFAFHTLHSNFGFDTLTLYAGFSGITTSNNNLNIPLVFQVIQSDPKFLITEQFFLNPDGCLFCTNPANGLAVKSFVGTTGTIFETLSGLAPGSPYTLTEVFTIAYFGSGGTVEQAGAAMWANPSPLTPVTHTPLPPAALLFGSALAGLGLLGRRKLKRAATLAA